MEKKNMTQEDKQLLLKDLCARLPYGVKIHVDYTFKSPYNVHLETDCGLVEFNVEKGEYLALTDRDNHSARKRFTLENIKPYLRPMSSMTEEEENEFISLNAVPSPCQLPNHTRMSWYSNATMLDWLNAHHFDYRGLIEKGLALEAPEGMYKTE